MIVLKAEDVKDFTLKLFLRETFDSFLVKEARITTYNQFSIDGHIRKGYFSPEELEEKGLEEYSAWSMLRPFCFSLIKGKKLPESFLIVLQLSGRNTEKFAAASGCGVDGRQIQGLYLNIRYEDDALYCITGIGLGFFTMDRTLEREWDEAVRKFLHAQGIVCSEQ